MRNITLILLLIVCCLFVVPSTADSPVAGVRDVAAGSDVFVYETIHVTTPGFGNTLYKMSGDITPVVLNTIGGVDQTFNLLEANVQLSTGMYSNTTDVDSGSHIYIWYPGMSLRAYLAGTYDSIDGKTINKDTALKFTVEAPKVGPVANTASAGSLQTAAKIYFTTPVGGKTTMLNFSENVFSEMNFANQAEVSGTTIVPEGATAGTYVAQAEFTNTNNVFPSIPNKYKKSNTVSFTVQSTTLTLTANKDSVVRSNPFTVTVQGQSNTLYFVYLDGINTGGVNPTLQAGQSGMKSYIHSATRGGVKLTDDSQVNIQNTFGYFTTDASGKRTIQYNTASTTEDRTYTITVYQMSEDVDGGEVRTSYYDKVKVKVDKGAVTITASGDRSYYIGEEVKLTGTNTDSSTVFLFVTGPNLLSDGQILSWLPEQFPAGTLRYGDASVKTDNTWEYKWDTSTCHLDTGAYTIYATSVLTNGKSSSAGTYGVKLSDSEYATVSVNLKQPFMSAVPSGTTVARGDKIYIRGTAEGDPPAIKMYIFGPNFFETQLVSIEDDGSYEKRINIDSGWSLNQYYVVIEHPMYNGQFDVYTTYSASPQSAFSGNANSHAGDQQIVIWTPTNTNSPNYATSSQSFIVWGTNKLQGSNAADALCKMIDSANIDDIYTKLAFTVTEPWIKISNPGDQTVGSTFTISGTTNLAVDNQILIEVVSSSFTAIDKTSTSTTSGFSQTTKVVAGADNDNVWSIEIDTTNFKVNEYVIKASGIEADVTSTTHFDLITGGTVVDPDDPVVPLPDAYLRVDNPFPVVGYNISPSGMFTPGKKVTGAVTLFIPEDSIGSDSYIVFCSDLSGSTWQGTINAVDGSYSIPIPRGAKRLDGYSLIGSGKDVLLTLSVEGTVSESAAGLYLMPMRIEESGYFENHHQFLSPKYYVCSPGDTLNVPPIYPENAVPEFSVTGESGTEGDLYSGMEVVQTVEVVLPAWDTYGGLTYQTDLLDPEWSMNLSYRNGESLVRTFPPSYKASGSISPYDLSYNEEMVLTVTVHGTVPAVLSGADMTVLQLDLISESGTVLQHYCAVKQSKNALIQAPPTIEMHGTGVFTAEDTILLSGESRSDTVWLTITSDTQAASPTLRETVTVSDGHWSSQVPASSLPFGRLQVVVANSADPVAELTSDMYAAASLYIVPTATYTLSDPARTIVKGGEYLLYGAAPETTGSVIAYVFGPNHYERTEVPVWNGLYLYRQSVDYAWSSNQYFVVLEFPGDDGTYAVVEEETSSGQKYLKYIGPDGEQSFIVWGNNKLQGSNAADALCKMLSASHADDVVLRTSFTVREPWIRINNPGDQTGGSLFPITGTTNLDPGSQILVEVVSSSFNAIDKTSTSTTSGWSQIAVVIPGDGDDNAWFITIDTTNFKLDEYTIKAQGIEADVTTTTNFNLVEGTPTVLPPDTPEYVSIGVLPKLHYDDTATFTGFAPDTVYLYLSEGIPGDHVVSLIDGVSEPDAQGIWRYEVDLVSPFREKTIYTLYGSATPLNPDDFNGRSVSHMSFVLHPEGGISLSRNSDDGVYSIGDTIYLSGYNKESDEVYLFLTGPNLLYDGEALPLRTPAWMNTNSIAVDSGGAWEYAWDTHDCGLDTGCYIIYATPVLTNGRSSVPTQDGTAVSLSDTEYATIFIDLKQPYLTVVTGQDSVPKGTTFSGEGEATGQPVNLTLYLFGDNTYSREEILVEDNHYSFTVELPDYAGRYYGLIVHPMYNSLHDVREIVTGNTTELAISHGDGTMGYSSFIVEGNGKLTGAAAARALVQMINSANVDDIYTTFTITAEGPWATISKPKTLYSDAGIQLTGTTNIDAGLDLSIPEARVSAVPDIRVSSSGPNTWTCSAEKLAAGTYTVTLTENDVHLADRSITVLDGSSLEEPGISPVDTVLFSSDTVLLSGVTGGYDPLYLVVTGGELTEPVRLETGTPVLSGSASTFTRVSVVGSAWYYNWIVGSAFPAGTYTISLLTSPEYTVSAPSVTVTIGEDSLTLAPLDSVRAGEEVTVTGEVHGSADEVTLYVFGDARTIVTRVPVEAGAFSLSVNTTDTGNCTIYAQYPVSGVFDVGTVPATKGGLLIALLSPTRLTSQDYFIMKGSGAVSGKNAADAFSRLIADPRVDDLFVSTTLNVYDTEIPSVLPSDTITLISGWNFVSVPKILKAGNNTAASLFGGVDTEGRTPLEYDAKTGTWVTLSGDTVIRPLTGYWVYAASAAQIPLTYPNVPTTPAVKSVYSGWNAIGLSSEEDISFENALTGISWRTLLPWNLATGKWGAAIINSGSGTSSPDRIITTGNGYWLYVTEGGVLTGLTA